MNYYRKQAETKQTIVRNTSYEGETIEQKIRRIVNNNEPISDGAPLIYTDRKDGVRPEYNVRTDRFELAIDAMDTVSKAHTAKRDMAIGERTYNTMTEQQQKKFNEEFPTNKHNKQTKGEA